MDPDLYQDSPSPKKARKNLFPPASAVTGEDYDKEDEDEDDVESIEEDEDMSQEDQQWQEDRHVTRAQNKKEAKKAKKMAKKTKKAKARNLQGPQSLALKQQSLRTMLQPPNQDKSQINPPPDKSKSRATHSQRGGGQGP